MDLKLHRPRGTCAVSGRPFTAGELFYSALVRGGGALERLDVAGTIVEGTALAGESPA